LRFAFYAFFHFWRIFPVCPQEAITRSSGRVVP
jgi:hypothetical protein